MELGTFASIFASISGALWVWAAWDFICLLEGKRVVARIATIAKPLVRIGREGGSPTENEQRRLVYLVAAVISVCGWIVGGVWFALAASLLAPTVSAGVLRVRRNNYRRTLNREAAAAARAVSDGLSAGHTIAGSITQAATALSGPVAFELSQLSRQIALGESIEDSLESLRTRARSTRWDSVVAAILLQRKLGGDLPALLRQQAVAFESAERVEADSYATTAQARFTAWIVMGLPVGALVLAELGSPGFALGLLNNPISTWFVFCSVVLQVVGLVAIKRVTGQFGVRRRIRRLAGGGVR